MQKVPRKTYFGLYFTPNERGTIVTVTLCLGNNISWTKGTKELNVIYLSRDSSSPLDKKDIRHSRVNKIYSFSVLVSEITS